MMKRMRWAWLSLTLAATSCSGCFDRARMTAEQKRAGEPKEAEKQPAPQIEARRDPRVRRAAMAGAWYPAERAALIAELDRLFAKAGEAKVRGNVIALISPHAGYTYSGRAAATGYQLLKGKDIRRVIVLGLSHHVPFRGASIADVTHYETPLGLIPIDETAVARLRRSPVVRSVEAVHQREHSDEIQLPLLQRVLPRFSLVPILISHMTEKDYGELATALADVVDAHTLVVASSDFTHRGPSYSYEIPEGKGSIKERLARLDQGSVDEILKLNRVGLLSYQERTGTTICGIAPIATLLELLSRMKGIRGQVVSRYTSGDVTGDWQSTVSYVDIAFSGEWPKRVGLAEARSAGERVFPLSAEDKRTLLQLARSSLEASVRKGSYDPAAARRFTMTSSLQRRAGAFVTLKCKEGPGGRCAGKGDGLRGCIGTILPISSVFETVAQRAASAALEDTRFNRVEASELPLIIVEISVLTPPRVVKSAEEIVVGRHGIILSKKGMSATFLPQVAPEQGWDRETTLTHLAHKAGLPTDGWRQGASFSVYEAIVFNEGAH
jgi:MEMO1 family protein